jgi:ATP-dependent Lon protease
MSLRDTSQAYLIYETYHLSLRSKVDVTTQQTLLDDKVLSVFGQLAIEKSRVMDSGLASVGFPVFVSEWVITSLAPGRGKLTAQEKAQIAKAAALAPGRNGASQIKDRLMRGDSVQVLDLIEVDVILGPRERRVAALQGAGLPDCDIAADIMDRWGESLLGAGMWGKVTLTYQSGGRPTISHFEPLQSKVDPALLAKKRAEFTLSEWRDLIVATCGWNPAKYSLQAKCWLLARLLPLAQRNYHLIELAPKGTGKSYLFENLTHFVRLVPGGDITAAQLVINNQSRRRGLLGRFDVVVFDELEQVRFKDEEEIIAGLKAYMANGQASRGGSPAYASDCSLLFMGNIALNRHLEPASQDYLGDASRYLKGAGSDALLDRFAGVIPGWEIPKFTADHRAMSVGLKLDFLAQTLRELRKDVAYEQYVRERVLYSDVDGGAIRDYNAVVATAAGYLKILFPDRRCSRSEFEEFCVQPAIAVRQLVRSTLYAREEEYRRQPRDLVYRLADTLPYGPPSEIVEGYEILDVIGEGGMGRVYRGRSSEGRLVAIKTSTNAITSLDHSFRREVEVANHLFRAGKLNHVIRILDLIRIQGRDALVLEYAEGGSLEDYLRRVEQQDEVPLDSVAVREVAESILLGIDELHSGAEPIIHRDIKPANILKVLGTWKLADFGIARFDLRPPSAQTVAGCRTPDYGPPEAAVSKTGDLFSFARTLVRVLAGHPLAALPPGVPESMKTILRECQDPEPEKRPESARVVLERLEPLWKDLQMAARRR